MRHISPLYPRSSRQAFVRWLPGRYRTRSCLRRRTTLSSCSSDRLPSTDHEGLERMGFLSVAPVAAGLWMSSELVPVGLGKFDVVEGCSFLDICEG